jgi:hypothetical protein
MIEPRGYLKPSWVRELILGMGNKTTFGGYVISWIIFDVKDLVTRSVLKLLKSYLEYREEFLSQNKYSFLVHNVSC